MKKKILMLLLCFTMLFSGCIQPEDGGTESGQQPTPNEQEHYYETATYVYQSNVDESALLTGLSQAYLLLANKEYILGESYTPGSLSQLTCETYGDKTIELETRTAEALYEMLQEMNAAGVTDIMVTSGYRSYAYQSSLFNYYLQLETSGISEDAYRCLTDEYIQTTYIDNDLTKLTYADARKVVLSYSAEPGTSEHQTGLCVDFITSTMTGLNTTFENTEAFAWLKDNAYKFGFILRYPEGKENITGYTYEPWHYRFVGREAATDIHFSTEVSTLEEYLGIDSVS